MRLGHSITRYFACLIVRSTAPFLRQTGTPLARAGRARGVLALPWQVRASRPSRQGAVSAARSPLAQKPKGAPAMALLAGLPKPSSRPSDHYTRTNPLRREGGLRLLTECLPDPLRWCIISAWRRPGFPNDKPVPLGLQDTQSQRLGETWLARFSPEIICCFALTE